MTVSLPPPVPLPQPPGSVDALDAVVGQLDTAGWCAGLAVHLLTPAVVLSGWQGADATSAAAEVGAALAVATDLHEAVSAAGRRLGAHLELWLAVRARTAQLSDDQRAQFATAGSRLAVLAATAAEVLDPTVAPAARRLVDTVTVDDAARGEEHRALLTALADDAAGVAAVLGSGSLRFGVSGRPGDGTAVTVRLAVQLPGWGAGALTGLGQQAAGELSRAGSAAELASAVVRWRPFSGLPGFADALVGRLGPDGVTWLLSLLADTAGTPEQEPLAALLAAALSGVGSLPGGHVGEVLVDLRLDAADPDGGVDRIALGMGLVLSAGAAPTLAAVWGRQLLAREAVQGTRAGNGLPGGAGDPVEAALAVLARAGDPEAAALLLDDRQAWRTLLSRPWPAGADALDAVIGLSIAAPDSGRVARSALLALGEGLAPGSAGRVLDDSGALAEVREAMAALVASRTDVVVPVLDAAATGAVLDTDADTALRGLGYLVADDEAAAAVTTAVRAALRAGEAGASAGEVAGAHVAVLEYGQRLRYALAWSHAQSRAVDAQILWSSTVSPLVAALPGGRGDLAAAVEGPLADLLDANGDVEIGPDTAVARTDEDAAAFAFAALGVTAVPGARAAPGAAARVGFDRAAGALGSLTPPPGSPLGWLDLLPLPDPGRPRRP